MRRDQACCATCQPISASGLAPAADNRACSLEAVPN